MTSSAISLRVSLRSFRPRKCIRHTQLPSFSDKHSLKEAVDLSSTAYLPEDGNVTDRALIILHGLFGSKRNWASICKALHRDMPERPIYALDLRNHGSSPHALPMTYEAMASDVRKFIEDKQLKNIALLGHSMGGKVAMSFALALQNEKPATNILSNLIVADIAPSIGSISPEFISYISAMQQIEALAPGVIKTRADADKKLEPYEQDISIRQFLLTNLQLPTPSRSASHDTLHDKAKFIVPLDILERSIEALGSFPYEYDKENQVAPSTYDGPTLVVKGVKSSYINHKNIPALRAFFPNMRMEELDAGHWVHAEKPNEFRKLVVDFLRG
ncbi:mitochondrial protein [Phlegmacium glaucopus]|nr:mitochondrial protein [Phlegmacium glaucopus]